MMSVLTTSGCGFNFNDSFVDSSSNSSILEPSSSSEQYSSESEVYSDSSYDSFYYPDTKPTSWKRFNDEKVYEHVLGEYEELAYIAKAETNENLRYVKFAKAEAALMDSASFMPITTQGGTYAMTRVAPHATPNVMIGHDAYRLKNMVVVKANDRADKNNFITSEDRVELIEKWNSARRGGENYEPAAILTGKGYELADRYVTTFSIAPATLDILNTSLAADIESLVNAIEGLVEYDNYGFLQPRLAKSLPTISNDGKTYTFELREGAAWYTADGQKYADVKADDFVAGFQHMLDAKAGYEWVAQGVIEGVSEYLAGKGSFDQVGYKAVDGKVQITLCEETPYFLSKLSYSCFMPMNREFFLEKGGAFGVAEFAEVKAKDTYTYGDVKSVSNMVYNSAFIPSKIVDKEEINYKKNPLYWDNAHTTLNELSWVYDAGDNPTASYNTAVQGGYSETSLLDVLGTLDLAKGDGNFNKYHYVTDTNAVTYFGGINVNRGTFEVGTVKSYKNEQQKIDYAWAIQNNNFRRALQHSWDRVTFNGVSVGEELAALSLRNIYTAPELVSLSRDVTYEGHTFAKGSNYGELVEYFLKEVYHRNAETEDGQDGWYNPTEARKYLYFAKQELGDDWALVTIEIGCYAGSKARVAQAQAFKESLENVLNYVADEDGNFVLDNDGEKQPETNVEINIMLAQNTTDYYADPYRATNGEDGCFDFFYGYGWGPDYGDPASYLDTFLGGGAGYMTKIIGLF